MTNPTPNHTGRRFRHVNAGPFSAFSGPGYAAAGFRRVFHVWADYGPDRYALAVSVRVPGRAHYVRATIGHGWGLSWPRVWYPNADA